MPTKEVEICLEVTDENWQAMVVDSETPVLVDFSAEWDGESRLIDPILDELADELWGQLKVARVNVDECPGLAAEFAVKDLPTLVMVVDGYEEDRLVGATTKDEIEERVTAFTEAA